MPYPSLSFVEYISSQEGFFTPLVYFLAGHYLDPWNAGEGQKMQFTSVQNLVSFLFIFLIWGPKMGSKIRPKFVNFWVQFWPLFFWGLGALWVPLGSLLGPLEALLGGLWTQKRVKTKCFLRVLKRQFFGLWSSWWPSVFILAASWANLVPR